MVDSYLGALLQYSGVDQRNMKVANDPSTYTLTISGIPVLSNNAVNALSTFLTSVLIMPSFAFCMKLFTAKWKSFFQIIQIRLRLDSRLSYEAYFVFQIPRYSKW